MNDDIFKGKWKQLKGKIKEKWGRFTDDDFTKINGKRDHFLGKLQEYYGWEKNRAEEELKHFEKSFDRDHFDKGDDHNKKRKIG